MQLLNRLLRVWRFQGGLSLRMEVCLASLLLTAMTVLSAWQLYRVQHDAAELAGKVEQSRQIVMGLRQFRHGASDMQSGARGYALLHDPSTLEQYYLGLEEMKSAAEALQTQWDGDATRKQKFVYINEKYQAYVTTVVPTLLSAIPVTSYTEQQNQLVRTGNADMQELRDAVGNFSDSEIERLRRLERYRSIRTQRAGAIYAAISLSTIFLGVLGGVLFAFRVRGHIVALTESARQVAVGDYGRRVETGGNREFGELAQAFNSMVIELEERRRQAALSKRFWELLHASASMSDVQATVAQLCPQWFPGSTGSLYVLNQARSAVESCGGWGDHAMVDSFSLMQCWALRMGRPHSFLDATTEVCCEHLKGVAEPTVCVPLVAHGETVGSIVLVLPYPEMSPAVLELSEALAMTIANLRLKERMQAEVNRDPLTGLFNRRYLNEALSRELARAHRHNLALTVIALDIDYFKSFNDNFGHSAGDLVLKQIARTLIQSLRSSDIVCRQGGEEFLAILPHCRPEDGGKWGEVIRQAVETLHVMHENQILGTITISAGVAAYPDHGSSMEDLLAAADRALYQSKEKSRNCVTIASPPSFPLATAIGEPVPQAVHPRNLLRMAIPGDGEAD